jgi:DNA recombination protein RmuC
MPLSALDLALIAVALVALGLAAALILRRGAGDGGVAELAGRLKQMAETQAAANTELTKRLQDQERALAQAVDQRLTALTGKIGETLEKSAKETGATVGELRERLVRIDAAQKQLGDLSSQVVGLRDILSNKQARGAFGEVMLEDLVRQVLPPAAYEFQAALGDGRRADCLLKLPNPPGPIAVDAKFPLEAWRALAEAADEAARTLAARAFAVAIGKHIKDIQEKYIVPGETAESALMFLPSEAVYAELHANHPGLVEQSFRAKVFIVSPTTLWATLNTVRAVLRDVEMRQQAGRIQVEVQRLVDDIGRLDERVENLQRHFAQAEKDVREIATSSGKVKSRAERIGEVDLDEGQSAEIADLAAARGALGSPKRT